MGSDEGRVVVLTGPARGTWRVHAVASARYGSRVVVDDRGAEVDDVLPGLLARAAPDADRRGVRPATAEV